MDVVDFDLAAEAYSGFLGRDISKDDLWLACSYVSQVERDFNLREGLQRKDDTLPVRFKDHPIPDGPAEGTTINIDHLVDDYYDVKGWERDGEPALPEIPSAWPRPQLTWWTTSFPTCRCANGSYPSPSACAPTFITDPKPPAPSFISCFGP